MFLPTTALPLEKRRRRRELGEEMEELFLFSMFFFHFGGTDTETGNVRKEEALGRREQERNREKRGSKERRRKKRKREKRGEREQGKRKRGLTTKPRLPLSSSFFFFFFFPFFLPPLLHSLPHAA